MKYIMFRNKSELDVPILFPDFIEHSNIANTFSNYTPISAGNVGITDSGDIIIYGNSTSLGLVALPHDEDIIKRLLRN